MAIGDFIGIRKPTLDLASGFENRTVQTDRISRIQVSWYKLADLNGRRLLHCRDKKNTDETLQSERLLAANCITRMPVAISINAMARVMLMGR